MRWGVFIDLPVNEPGPLVQLQPEHAADGAPVPRVQLPAGDHGAESMHVDLQSVHERSVTRAQTRRHDSYHSIANL